MDRSLGLFVREGHARSGEMDALGRQIPPATKGPRSQGDRMLQQGSFEVSKTANSRAIILHARQSQTEQRSGQREGKERGQFGDDSGGTNHGMQRNRQRLQAHWWRRSQGQPSGWLLSLCHCVTRSASARVRDPQKMKGGEGSDDGLAGPRSASWVAVVGSGRRVGRPSRLACVWGLGQDTKGGADRLGGFSACSLARPACPCPCPHCPVSPL